MRAAVQTPWGLGILLGVDSEAFSCQSAIFHVMLWRSVSKEDLYLESKLGNYLGWGNNQSCGFGI